MFIGQLKGDAIKSHLSSFAPTKTEKNSEKIGRLRESGRLFASTTDRRVVASRSLRSRRSHRARRTPREEEALSFPLVSSRLVSSRPVAAARGRRSFTSSVARGSREKAPRSHLLPPPARHGPVLLHPRGEEEEEVRGPRLRAELPGEAREEEAGAVVVVVVREEDRRRLNRDVEDEDEGRRRQQQQKGRAAAVAGEAEARPEGLHLRQPPRREAV
eukprot:30161-Pelagococcus_subviridis.AAC.3